MTIKPEDCTPDQVFEGTVDGVRITLRRNRKLQEAPWEGMGAEWGDGGYWPDSEVSDLVPLVPARPLTWEDIPRELPWGVECTGGEPPVLDRLTDLQRRHIAARINARGGVPTTAPAVGDAEADPIVEAIRESDLAAVGVRKGVGFWVAKKAGSVSVTKSLEEINDDITSHLGRAAAYLAVKRAIEVEEKAKKGAARAEWTTALFGDGALFLELDNRDRGLVARAIAKAGESK